MHLTLVVWISSIDSSLDVLQLFKGHTIKKRVRWVLTSQSANTARVTLKPFTWAHNKNSESTITLAKSHNTRRSSVTTKRIASSFSPQTHLTRRPVRRVQPLVTVNGVNKASPKSICPKMPKSFLLKRRSLPGSMNTSAKSTEFQERGLLKTKFCFIIRRRACQIAIIALSSIWVR